MPQQKLESSRQAVSICNVAKIEELRGGRTTGRRTGEHGVGGEERREHHDVGQQEYPEPVADDDALGRGAAFAVPGRPRLSTVAAEGSSRATGEEGSRSAVSGVLMRDLRRVPGRERRGSHGRCARPPRAE